MNATATCRSDRAIPNVTRWSTALALAAMLAYGNAAAQGTGGGVHPALQDRWHFQLGAYFSKVDTTAT